MKKIQKFLGSHEGMRLINVLFILATLSRNNILIILACLFWIIYLRYCIITKCFLPGGTLVLRRGNTVLFADYYGEQDLFSHIEQFARMIANLQ